MGNKKRGIITEYLPWIILSVAGLVIILIVVFSLRTQGISLIDQIKDLFRK